MFPRDICTGDTRRKAIICWNACHMGAVSDPPGHPPSPSLLPQDTCSLCPLDRRGRPPHGLWSVSSCRAG